MTIAHPTHQPPTHQAQTRRARRRRIAAAGSALALVMGLGLGVSQAEAIGSHGGSVVAQDPGARVPPPSVHLRTDTAGLSLRPYVACWSGRHSGFCYDGIAPKPLPALGGTSAPITIAFARDGWHFQVDVYDATGHHTRLHVRQLGEREWRLVTGDLELGTYRADIFGNGPQGDVLVSATFTLV